MKILRVISAIVSLCFMVFLILCTYSPVQPSVPVPAEGTQADAPSEAEAPKTELTLPFVTPKVTLTAGSFSEDTQELTARLVNGETALLSQFTQLKSADFSGSVNVEEIAAWASAHPEVTVRYTVTLPDGRTVDNGATALDLSNLRAEDAEKTVKLLRLLPKLNSIELGVIGGEGLSFAALDALRAELPLAQLHYRVQLLGQTLGEETESVDLSAATSEEFEAALQVLNGLPNLKTVVLGDESGNIKWADVWKLNEVCPNAVYDYSYTLCGMRTNLNAPDINLSHVTMSDNGEAVRNVLPLLHACTVVDMDSCGVSNADMRAMRDAFPNIKFVWRIWFGTNYSVRTDVIKILASKPSKGGMIYDSDVDALSCCTDLKYIDLGHNSDLHDISFFYSMPNIEVVILTLTGVTDITPLSACPHLEYLEVTHTGVSDLSPLANSQELRHLNVGDSQVSDITCLYGLKDLERLFLCYRHHVPQDQIDEMQRIAPDCEIDTVTDDPSNGHWRFADLNDDGWAAFVASGNMYFKFENTPRYELLREQFGYDNAEYAFSWLDPLY